MTLNEAKEKLKPRYYEIAKNMVPEIMSRNDCGWSQHTLKNVLKKFNIENFDKYDETIDYGEIVFKFSRLLTEMINAGDDYPEEHDDAITALLIVQRLINKFDPESRTRKLDK